MFYVVFALTDSELKFKLVILIKSIAQCQSQVKMLTSSDHQLLCLVEVSVVSLAIGWFTKVNH